MSEEVKLEVLREESRVPVATKFVVAVLTVSAVDSDGEMGVRRVAVVNLSVGEVVMGLVISLVGELA